jgi:hypothetical protein
MSELLRMDELFAVRAAHHGKRQRSVVILTTASAGHPVRRKSSGWWYPGIILAFLPCNGPLSAMMSTNQFVGLMIMISLLATGNLLGLLSLVLSHTKMRGKRVVPITGIMAFACGIPLLAILKIEPGAGPFYLAAGFPVATGGIALYRYYRQTRTPKKDGRSESNPTDASRK